MVSRVKAITIYWQFSVLAEHKNIKLVLLESLVCPSEAASKHSLKSTPYLWKPKARFPLGLEPGIALKKNTTALWMKQFINFFIKQSFDHYIKLKEKKIFTKKWSCLLWLCSLMESWQEKKKHLWTSQKRNLPGINQVGWSHIKLVLPSDSPRTLFIRNQSKGNNPWFSDCFGLGPKHTLIMLTNKYLIHMTWFHFLHVNGES